MEQSSPGQFEPVVTTSGRATVERLIGRSDAGIVAEFALTSTSDEPVIVEVVDRFPGNWDVDEVEFVADDAPRAGSAGEGKVAFEALVHPNQETVVAYVLSLREPPDPGSIQAAAEFSVPHIDSVGPVPAGEDGRQDVDDDGPAAETDRIDDPAVLFERDAERRSDSHPPEAWVPDAEAGSGTGSTDDPVAGSVGERLLRELEAGTLSEEQLAELGDVLRPITAGRTAARLRRVESRLAEFDAYVDALGSVIDEHGSVSNLVTDLQADLDALERASKTVRDELDTASTERDRIDGRLDSIADVVGQNETRLDALVDWTAELEAGHEELESAIEDTDGTVEELRETVDRLDSAVDAIGDRVDDCERVRARLASALNPGRD